MTSLAVTSSTLKTTMNFEELILNSGYAPVLKELRLVFEAQCTIRFCISMICNHLLTKKN